MLQKYYKHNIDNLIINESKEAEGTCPFHDGHESSFHINLNNGHWRCTWCNTGGTIEEFSQKLDNINNEGRDKGGKSVLQAALESLETGFCPIPIEPDGKKPLVSWKKYQDQFPTKEEVQDWFKKWPDANVAVITGAISG